MRKFLATLMAVAMLFTSGMASAATTQSKVNDAIDESDPVESAYGAYAQIAGYASEVYIDDTLTQDDIIVNGAKKFVEEYPDEASAFPELSELSTDDMDEAEEVIKKAINGDEDMLVKFSKAAYHSLDQYSEFFTAGEFNTFQSDINQHFYGIGVILHEERDGVYVQGFTDNSAAEAAGVKAGDKFMAVDGTDVSSATTQKLRELILGELDTEVKVTFKREGTTYTVTIKRCAVNGKTVNYQILKDENVGYISISDMGDETDNEFWTALNEMDIAGIDDIIIDLRYNGGGYLTSAIYCSQEVVPFGLICSTQYRKTKNKINNYYSHLDDTKYNLKVLVNGGTASAAEIFASAMKESGAAVLYGEQTFGKGVIQTTYNLQNGSVLKLTTGKYMTRDGNEINKIGITPNVKVENRRINLKVEDYTPFDFATNWNVGDQGDGVKSAKEKLSEMRYYSGEIDDVYTDDLQQSILNFKADKECGNTTTIDVETQRRIDQALTEYVIYEDTQLNTALEMFKYDDLDDYTWAQPSIAELSYKKIVQGTEDGKYSPADNVTRAEAAAMLVRAFDIQGNADNNITFNDVNENDWYYDVVSRAASSGLLKGDENGNFNPNDNITREDMALLIKRSADAFGIELSGDRGIPFTDWEKVDDYAKLAVSKMIEAGIMSGESNQIFAPLQGAERAEAAVVLDRLLCLK